MTITLGPELEAALIEEARKTGIAPQVLALDVLHRRFNVPGLMEPRDAWERQLRGIATDCGVALSDEAVSSEGIYD